QGSLLEIRAAFLRNVARRAACCGHGHALDGLVARASDSILQGQHRKNGSGHYRRSRPLHSLARPGARVQNWPAENPRTADACGKRTRSEIRQAEISRRGSGKRRHPFEPARIACEGVDHLAEPLNRSIKSITLRRGFGIGSGASVIASGKEKLVAEKFQFAV